MKGAGFAPLMTHLLVVILVVIMVMVSVFMVAVPPILGLLLLLVNVIDRLFHNKNRFADNLNPFANKRHLHMVHHRMAAPYGLIRGGVGRHPVA